MPQIRSLLQLCKTTFRCSYIATGRIMLLAMLCRRIMVLPITTSIEYILLKKGGSLGAAGSGV